MPPKEQAAKKEAKPPDWQEELKKMQNTSNTFSMAPAMGTGVMYLNAPAGSQTYTAASIGTA